MYIVFKTAINGIVSTINPANCSKIRGCFEELLVSFEYLGNIITLSKIPTLYTVNNKCNYYYYYYEIRQVKDNKNPHILGIWNRDILCIIYMFSLLYLKAPSYKLRSLIIIGVECRRGCQYRCLFFWTITGLKLGGVLRNQISWSVPNNQEIMWCPLKTVLRLVMVLPNNINAGIVFQTRKLASQFRIKDQASSEHRRNLVYQATCPDCPDTYVGETARRLQTRINEHSTKDKKIALLRHSTNSGHWRACQFQRQFSRQI